MRSSPTWQMLFGFSLCSVVLVVVLMTGTAIAEDTQTIIWQLRKGETVEAGSVIEAAPGYLLKGHVIRAKAKTTSKAVPQGVFELTLSVFSPAQDMPGQKAGTWYVRGNWTITDAGLQVATGKMRRAAGMMKGDFEAELPFNPVESDRSFSGLVRLPKSTDGETWGSGEGTLTLNKQRGGELYLEFQPLAKI